MTKPRLRLYDSTRLDAAKTCMRLYYLRHCRHYRSEGTKEALVFGSSWGAAMDVVWRRYDDLYVGWNEKVIDEAYQAFIAKWTSEGFKHPDDLTIDDISDLGARTPTNALEMLGSYINARENLFTAPTFELLTIEEPFIVPLDPNDPSLFYVGRMDKKFLYRGKIYGLDHKTTSLYRGTQKTHYTFAPDWIDSWGMNDQVDGYSYSGHQQHGKEFGGIYIDGALVHKTEHRLFNLIPIDKQLSQLNAWLWETISLIDDIEANKAVLEDRSAQDTEYLAAFRRNRKSCNNYNSKCAYFDTCRMVANPARLKAPPLGFIESEWRPFDELKLEQLGLSKENVEP